LSKPSRRALGIVWLILGLVLIASDSAAGWLFFIMGLTWMARPGIEDVTPERAHLVRRLTVALAVITGLIAIGTLLLRFMEGL
jgi:hypothetical protein